MFALGICLYELIFYVDPPKEGEAYQALRNGTIPGVKNPQDPTSEPCLKNLPPRSPQLFEVLQRLLNPKASERLTAEGLLSHPRIKALGYPSDKAEPDTFLEEVRTCAARICKLWIDNLYHLSQKRDVAVQASAAKPGRGFTSSGSYAQLVGGSGNIFSNPSAISVISPPSTIKAKSRSASRTAGEPTVLTRSDTSRKRLDFSGTQARLFGYLDGIADSPAISPPGAPSRRTKRSPIASSAGSGFFHADEDLSPPKTLLPREHSSHLHAPESPDSADADMETLAPPAPRLRNRQRRRRGSRDPTTPSTSSHREMPEATPGSKRKHRQQDSPLLAKEAAMLALESGRFIHSVAVASPRADDLPDTSFPTRSPSLSSFHHPVRQRTAPPSHDIHTPSPTRGRVIMTDDTDMDSPPEDVSHLRISIPLGSPSVARPARTPGRDPNERSSRSNSPSFPRKSLFAASSDSWSSSGDGRPRAATTPSPGDPEQPMGLGIEQEMERLSVHGPESPRDFVGTPQSTISGPGVLNGIERELKPRLQLNLRDSVTPPPELENSAITHFSPRITPDALHRSLSQDFAPDSSGPGSRALPPHQTITKHASRLGIRSPRFQRSSSVAEFRLPSPQLPRQRRTTVQASPSAGPFAVARSPGQASPASNTDYLNGCVTPSDQGVSYSWF